MDKQSIDVQLQNLGNQLEKYRLLRDVKQTDLAKDAGISTRTLGRLEAGEGGTLETLVRVLNALDTPNGLETLVPDSSVRPMDRLRSKKAEERKRASSKPKEVKEAKARLPQKNGSNLGFVNANPFQSIMEMDRLAQHTQALAKAVQTQNPYDEIGKAFKATQELQEMGKAFQQAQPQFGRIIWGDKKS